METKELKEVIWGNKLYLLYNNERWLNEQAAKGMILKDFDKKTARFEVDEPQNITYKILIINKKNAEDQIKRIERQGFTLVERYNEYCIFSRLGKYDQIWLRLDDEEMTYTKIWFNKQILKRFAHTLYAFLPIAIKLLIHQNGIIKGIVEISTLWYAICMILFIWLGANALNEYTTIIRTKTCFMNHENYILHSKEKESIWEKLIIAIFCTLVGIAIFQYLYVDSIEYSIREVSRNMPVVLLQDIEQEPEKDENKKDGVRQIMNDKYAEIHHTWLAPNQYFSQQADEYNTLYINYYELNTKLLVKALTEELSTANIFELKKKS